MFDFEWLDLFSLHTLLAAIGWTMAIGMAIHHLHLVKPHRVRSFFLIAGCILGLCATIMEGALEHKETRVVSDGIENIQRTINAGNGPPSQILADASSRLVKQKIEILKLNDRFSDIQESIRRLSITPPPTSKRHLSNGEMTDLVNSLRSFSSTASKVDLSCSVGDARGCIHADQWLHVLKNAGWSVNGVGQEVSTPTPPLGVRIQVNNAEVPGAAILQRAFSSVGTPATGEIVSQMPSDKIRLIVGAE